MSSWLERLRGEAKGVASAPFAGMVLVATAVIWAVLHWSYQATLTGKDRQIAMLEHRVAEYRESVSGAMPDEAKRRIETLGDGTEDPAPSAATKASHSSPTAGDTGSLEVARRSAAVRIDDPP
jgi:hypothetical protein